MYDGLSSIICLRMTTIIEEACVESMMKLVCLVNLCVLNRFVLMLCMFWIFVMIAMILWGIPITLFRGNHKA